MAFSIAFRGLSNRLRITSNYWILFPRFSVRKISTSPTCLALKLEEEGYLSGKWNTFKENTIALFRKKRYTQYQLAISGENLYTLCAEFPDYSDFVHHMKLPDSYQTWFAITALHVWLCLVRLRTEGVEGKFVREILFKTLFEDIEKRTRGFKVADKTRDIGILQNQLYGALFAYDEGLLSDEDKILAASLWRDFFFMRPDTQAEDLELMVSYVRKQLQFLDNQSSDQIFKLAYVKFLPLVGDKEDKAFTQRRLKFSLTIPTKQEIESLRSSSKESQT